MKIFLYSLLIASMLIVAFPVAAKIDSSLMTAQISGIIDDLVKSLSLLKEKVADLEEILNDESNGGSLTATHGGSDVVPIFSERLERGVVDAVLVPRLQACLRDLGYLQINGSTDVFGPKTEEAVVSFQRSENIIDHGGKELGQGVLGPLTRGRLNTLCPNASSSSIQPPSLGTTSGLQMFATLTVSKDPGVPSQNISINVPNQPLGGFWVDVTKEPVVVNGITFRVSQWFGSGSSNSDRDITEITLQRSDGTIIAGPVSIDFSSPTITFPDRIVYPVGRTSVILKGRLGFDYDLNDLIAASTTPLSDWKNSVGQNSGQIVVPKPSFPVTGNVMTVKKPALSISVSAVPPSQTVRAPQTQFTFANYIFDLANSAEDVRIWQWPFEYNVADGDPTNLRECKLYDGNTVLTTGSNVVNPTVAASSTIFVLDNPFIFNKLVVKILTLKCDIVAGARGMYAWGYDESSNPIAIGNDSGLSADITEYDNMGQIMTVIP